MEALFQDWAMVARALGKLPSVTEYEQNEPIQPDAAGEALWNVGPGPAWVEAVH